MVCIMVYLFLVSDIWSSMSTPLVSISSPAKSGVQTRFVDMLEKLGEADVMISVVSAAFAVFDLGYTFSCFFCRETDITCALWDFVP